MFRQQNRRRSGERSRKTSTYIKAIFPSNYETFWLEPAVKGILNQTQARGAVILYEGFSDVEKTVSNHITTEFLKQIPLVKIDYRAYVKKVSLFSATWYNQPLFAIPKHLVFILLFHVKDLCGAQNLRNRMFKMFIFALVPWIRGFFR